MAKEVWWWCSCNCWIPGSEAQDHLKKGHTLKGHETRDADGYTEGEDEDDS